MWTRYARAYRSAVVVYPITYKGNKSEFGRSPAFGRAAIRRAGPHGEGNEPKANDERTREVRPRSSSCEVHKRRWVTSRGVDGAKGGRRPRGMRPGKARSELSVGLACPCAGSHTEGPRTCRTLVTHPRWEPDAGKLQVRFCVPARCVPTAIRITPNVTYPLLRRRQSL